MFVQKLYGNVELDVTDYYWCNVWNRGAARILRHRIKKAGDKATATLPLASLFKRC